MTKKKPKKSLFSTIRNNFIAGIVVLIPIGITLYLTLFFIKISSNILPKEINQVSASIPIPGGITFKATSIKLNVETNESDFN